MHNEFFRFVVFWSGSSLYLVFLMVVNVSSGVIHWGEGGVTTIAHLGLILIYLDLVLLLGYISILYDLDPLRGLQSKKEEMSVRYSVCPGVAQRRGHREPHDQYVLGQLLTLRRV